MHRRGGDGDGELLVRASAVLKSQGPENWSRGRPGLVRARTNSRSVRDRPCGKIRGGEKPLVGWRRMTSQVRGTCGFLFVRKWGEGPVTVHKKGASSFGRVRPRSRGEPSHRQVAVGHLHRSAEGSRVRPPSRGQCAQMQLVAAPLPAPVHASGNHRCGFGWERDAVESGGGVAGSSYGSIAGTTVAGAVSSGLSLIHI